MSRKAQPTITVILFRATLPLTKVLIMPATDMDVEISYNPACNLPWLPVIKAYALKNRLLLITPLSFKSVAISFAPMPLRAVYLTVSAPANDLGIYISQTNNKTTASMIADKIISMFFRVVFI